MTVDEQAHGDADADAPTVVVPKGVKFAESYVTTTFPDTDSIPRMNPQPVDAPDRRRRPT